MPHIGDSYSQCADRFAVGKEKHCFAIADGVGNSLFPEDWAEIVCNDYIMYPDIFHENDRLIRETSLISEWEKRREEKVSNLTDMERFIYETGLEKADFAACTFVGLRIVQNKWYCDALGDSYLFVIDRDCEIIDSVASQKGNEFDNFPEYFASAIGKNNGKISSRSGDIEDVAYFVLLTDAISDWFIKVDKSKRSGLIGVKDIQEFSSFVTKERECGIMKDDDTTAIIIEVVRDNKEELCITEIYNTDIQSLVKENVTEFKQPE